MKCILMVILAGLIIGCKPSGDNTGKNYHLQADDTGIQVEVFDSLNNDPTRYTANNQIYTAYRAFRFSYTHTDTLGNTYYFRPANNTREDELGWQFVPTGSADSITIREVVISVKPDLSGFLEIIPDYNQTVVQYNYFTEAGEASFRSSSGIIENEANVWAHPPRDLYFRILELNPFPYIKAPYTVGTAWTWSLDIGGFWGDRRWKTWEGVITNKYKYRITDFRKYNTPLGELACYEISGTATSELGDTKLIALFNEEYGFVQLNYTNIDGSKTRLELQNVSEVRGSQKITLGFL